MLCVATSAICGALLASLLACIPGLHIYNIMALGVMSVHLLGQHGVPLSAEIIVPFMAAMVIAHAIVSTIPSVLLAAPDESAVLTVLPGQKFLMLGRGYEGVLLTGAGGLAGALFLVFVGGPLAPHVLPVVATVFRPHTHWVLWTVIAFMLMSEWPRGGRLGTTPWERLWDSWRATGAGLMTFGLAGVLGFVLLYRSPIDPRHAFQNLMPAFVGLFGVPWLLLNLAGGVVVPAQTTGISDPPDARRMGQGILAGILGGAFAAFFPVVTGGVGGLLAGHATALRDDRVFLISQGASKVMYYAGGAVLFFIPGLHLTRGGAAWMLKALHAPHSYYDYNMVLAAIGLGGAVAFLLLGPLTRLTLVTLQRAPCRLVSALALGLILVLVLAITGLMGCVVLAVATGIGLLPVLLGSRRMNCLSVILLPMACNMSGVGVVIAGWLGLL